MDRHTHQDYARQSLLLGLYTIVQAEYKCNDGSTDVKSAATINLGTLKCIAKHVV